MLSDGTYGVKKGTAELPSEVIIPAKYQGKAVTQILENAFVACMVVTSITIPESVTSSGGMEFYGCSGLMSITIPSSVTSIGDDVFRGCSRLANINFEGTRAQWDAALGTSFLGCDSTIVHCKEDT